MPRFFRFRIIWPLLGVLVAFVLFVEFVADVGSSGVAEHSPPFMTLPTASPGVEVTPTPTPLPQDG
jgi:hypothetical protein